MSALKADLPQQLKLAGCRLNSKMWSGYAKRGLTMSSRIARSMVSALITVSALTGAAMAQERIKITSDWGTVTAVLADNDASGALLGMLPLTINMNDHLRQEKTGELPSPLPSAKRSVYFQTGTLGLWSSDKFVIYYRAGRVPQPGIITLGELEGDASIFDRTGDITVHIDRLKSIVIESNQL